MYKKWFITIFVGLMLILAACAEEGQGEAETAVEGDGDFVVGMSVINQEALFFTEMVKGAEEKAEELGITLNVHNANNDQVEQNNTVENYIAEGVDALVINAYDPGSLNPVIEKAKEEGIIIISVDTIIESDAVDVQIGVDNAEESVNLAAYFNDYWGDEEVNLGVITALNAPIQVNRQDSFIDSIENAEIVDILDGENVQEKALTAAENLFISNTNLDAVYITGEPGYIGAVSAIKSQGVQDDVKLFGWDLSPQVVQGIDEGFVEAVIQQHPDEYGSEAVNAAYEIFQGNEVNSPLDVPATIVTEDNIDEFRDLFE
ncbi:substrate-binding domain-containing protein [Oceanobacillus sojae]|uniref:Sugar ABC transporter substrate-binding protein n=1 Tax=Oceanobacillus sojae TaxID=582851 RepID=A0A511ZM11_9BACI|nr:substrate-binding domain-containing protein [Oceanobacillus sojae]GEN88485.1 sugar ABC transporter substrate-binding protein [Oceanobacillus sojae]